jgi:hypothetical protein
VVLVLEHIVTLYGRVPLARLQLIAKSKAYGQAAEVDSSNHFVDRRSYERCSGLIEKACWIEEVARISNAVLFVSHPSPYQLPKYVIIVAYNVPQREKRDRHDGHDVVRVRCETCTFLSPDQCMNSDDRGMGHHYGYQFASIARCFWRPMRLF